MRQVLCNQDFLSGLVTNQFRSSMPVLSPRVCLPASRHLRIGAEHVPTRRQASLTTTTTISPTRRHTLRLRTTRIGRAIYDVASATSEILNLALSKRKKRTMTLLIESTMRPPMITCFTVARPHYPVGRSVHTFYAETVLLRREVVG